MYYNVQLPAVEVGPGQLPSSKPMFFSREWSVGKVVDSIAQKYKLKNENNRLHSGVSRPSRQSVDLASLLLHWG